MAQMFPEPHSTKQIEDTTGWGLETTPEVLIATIEHATASGTYRTEDAGATWKLMSRTNPHEPARIDRSTPAVETSNTEHVAICF